MCARSWQRINFKLNMPVWISLARPTQDIFWGGGVCSRHGEYGEYLFASAFKLRFKLCCTSVRWLVQHYQQSRGAPDLSKVPSLFLPHVLCFPRVPRPVLQV